MFIIGEWAGFWLWKGKALTVSRMQDKIVITPDGAMHAVIGGGAWLDMAIYTSHDGGWTWTRDFAIEGTGELSTAHLDLLPDGETLTISFQDEQGDVKYQALTYHPYSGSWCALTDPVTVVTGNWATTVSLPTHVQGADGELYLLSMGTSFVVPVVDISISYDDGATWETNSVRIPGVEKSSVRMISTEEVTGAIVATEHYVGWLDVTQVDEGLVEISNLGSYSVFASHFSTTVVGNDIYLANVTDEELPQVEFFKYEGDTGEWSDGYTVPHTFEAEAYVQVSSNTEGHVYLIFDDFGTSRLRVLESVDEGQSWEIEAEIDVGPDVVPAFTRLVAPEFFTEDLVIFQMVQPWPESNFFGISVAVVDVDGDGSAEAVRAEAEAAAARWQAELNVNDREGGGSLLTAEAMFMDWTEDWFDL